MEMANIKREIVEAELDEIIQVASGQYNSSGNNNMESANNNSKSSPPSMAGTTAPTSEDDNMDFDSDDDDDESKSNHSSSNRRRKFSHQKGDIKRSHHNVLERKRRDLIKDSFTKLREVVPTLSNERASRAQILKKAADFIQLTNQKNETTRSSIDELVQKNLELERKISAAKQLKQEQQPNP